MEAARDSMAALLDAGLFDSAQTLGCFLVSSGGTGNEAAMSMKVESLVLHGDALYGEKEFRRALSAYKQAMQYSKSIPRQATSNTRSSVSTTGRSPSPNSSNVMPFNENEVKFKIALCHSALHEYREALQEMEGIPSKLRTLKMNLMFGKLYRISRNNRAASVCYKECLRQCPYVFEAIVALAEMGLSSKEFSLLFSQNHDIGGSAIMAMDIKLDGPNYREWAFTVRTVMGLADLVSHLTDDPPDPKTTDSAALKCWQKGDPQVMGALVLSVEVSLRMNLEHHTSAKEMWKYFEQRYLQPSGALCFSLLQNLHNMWQQDMSIDVASDRSHLVSCQPMIVKADE